MIKPKFSFALRENLSLLCQERSTVELPLTPELFLPTKAESKASGYDVRCAIPEGILLKPYCYMKIPLGFRMFAPEGWWLQLAPRSGTFIKLHIHALYGIIDETYENEMVFVGQYIPDGCDMLSPGVDPMIKFGERIAQVVPVERQDMEIEGVSNSDIESLYKNRNASRGTGGFGSTGKI